MTDGNHGLDAVETSTTDEAPDVEVSRTVEIGPQDVQPEVIGPVSVTLPEGEEFEMTVGDVKSDEMGTAARANGGKPAFDLMPLEQVAQLIRDEVPISDMVTKIDHARMIEVMSDFQRDEIDAYSLLRWAVAYLWVYGPSVDDNAHVMNVLEDVCYVWDYGRRKYAEWNWAKGAPWSVPLACMARHIRDTIVDADAPDKDSGRSHAAHVVCNAMMLVHYSKYWNHRGANEEGLVADDRPYQFFQMPDPVSPRLRKLSEDVLPRGFVV